MSKGNQAFETHVQSRTDKPPAVLYKYTTARTAHIILSTGKLRFQSPLKYNDPFDSQWDMLWPLQTPEALERMRSIIELALRDPSSWPPDIDTSFRRAIELERSQILQLPDGHRDAAIATIARSITEFPIPEPVSQGLLDIRRRMRIQCFSEDDRSLLMWSHYANQHQGVVLGFSSQVLEDSLRRPLEPVAYTEGPPTLFDRDSWIRSVVFGTPRADFFGREREWALSKHIDWKYEKEWRFVFIAQIGTPGTYLDIKFPPNAIVEIVSGCRTDDMISNDIVTAARATNPGIPHFRMIRHANRFELLKHNCS